MKAISLIAVACLAILGSLPPTAGGQGIHQGKPPTKLHGRLKTRVLLPTGSPALWARLSYDTSNQGIVLKWLLRWQGTVHRVGQQVSMTSFWPTEVCYAGPNKLLVAGKRPIQFTTVIELWTFEEVEPTPAPYTDPATGQTVWPEVTRSITSKKVLYEDSKVGMDMAAIILRNEGNGNALVQFWDSRDVYDLDISTGALTKVFGASPDPALPQLPYLGDLDDEFTDRASFENATHGFVYQFLFAESSQPAVYLFDGDRDGSIDAAEVVTVERWVELNLSEGFVRGFY